jgi:mannose-6-phosphate isomerase
VRAGDTVFVPAGTVHAIGAGLALCEIQQPSDITYRLYDYGRPRELHLERGLAVAGRGCHPGLQRPGGAVLADCPYFRVEKHDVRGERVISPARPELLIFLAGSGAIAGKPFAAGEVWLVRAGEAPFAIAGEATLLEAVAP